MKSGTRQPWLIAFAVVTLTALLCSARSMPPNAEARFPGMLHYTPTRLEWLALNLEASYRTDFSSDGYYSLNFLPDPPDTILIIVQYSDNASAGVVEKAIKSATKIANMEASNHGWSSWVKVKVDRKVLTDAKP